MISANIMYTKGVFQLTGLSTHHQLVHETLVAAGLSLPTPDLSLVSHPRSTEQQFPAWKFLREAILILSRKLANNSHFQKLFNRF